MKMTSSFLKCVIVIFLFLSVVLWTYAGYCDNTTASYSYNPAGKPNPFKSFIDEIKKKPTAKSPLEMISIDELKLVGIASSGKKRFAMVEKIKGNPHHYVIYSGTPIGLNEGRVVSILADRVIITEKIETSPGRAKTKRIIWKLRAEENERNP